MEHYSEGPFKKRGSVIQPGNRFETTHLVNEWDDLQYEEPKTENSIKTQFLFDQSKSILTKNQSPDIGFTYSINAYRGCEHGCAYCYARPTHETLGFNAGIDFETKIMVKQNAPELLRAALQKPSWQKETIAISGVTDCYQPAEKRFELTRRCLEILLEFDNPAVIVTKNILVLRDLDLLEAMAKKNLLRVCVSVTSLNQQLQSVLEPRTATPAARLFTISRLAAHGIPVTCLMAPIIPGLTDHEIPELLAAVAKAGARCAHYTLLRLPLNVQSVFFDWAERHVPEKLGKIKSLLTQMRGGRLNDSDFGSRMVGEGPFAKYLETTFAIFKQKNGLICEH